LNSQKQRQFVRLKTRQAARIRFSDDSVVECEIRDFCPTGFYLSFSGQEAGAMVGPSLAQSSIVVEFPAGAGATLRTHAVPGRVAHCGEAGLGIFADEMPTPAFQAMLEHRAGLYRSAGEAKPEELDPVDARTIRLQCLSLYRPFLSRVINEFFRLANAHGAEEYRGGGAGLGDQPPFLAALGQLKLERDGIQNIFATAALARVEQGSAQAAGAKDKETGELSLVEEDEFDDWLNLAAVINKLEAGLHQYLGFFERLYHLLSARDQEKDYDAAYFQGSLGQSSPFSPDALCRAFQRALQGVNMGVAQRAVFYRLFGQAVALHGAAFYESLTNVAAVAERRQVRSGERRRASDQDRFEAPVIPGGQVAAPQMFGAEANAAESMGYSLDRTLAALNASGLMGPTTVPVPQAGGAPPGPGLEYAGAIALESSLIRTTGVLQQVVSQLSKQMPAGEMPYALTLPAGTEGLPEASTNEILLALDGLLQTRQGHRPEAWNPSLTEQLRTRLAKAGGDAVTIAPQQQQLLDSLANLFDQVMGEYSPASELEGLLKRFEAPFFKLALKDPDFLVSDKHPARQVINILDQYAIAADDTGKFFDPKLPKVLAVLVDNIIAKADQEPDVYEKAVQTLEKMLQPLQKVRKQRIHRLQETSEGKHRILQSRIRVLTELEARLGGRQVPRMLLRLLDSGWRHYLSLLELREGMQGREWEAGIDVVDRLLVWLAPDFRPGEDYALDVAELMRQLGQGMATVCIEPNHLDCLFREVDAVLLGRIRDPALGVEHVQLEPGRVLRGYEEEGGELPKDSKLREQLVLGSWWNIVIEGSKPTPVQLIWLSQPPGNCAFANRSATKKYEFSVAELARMKEAGRAELATDKELPILERSESSLIDAVYKHLSHQTNHDPVTDLINRKALLQQLGLMASMPVCKDQVHALGILEFDQLRVIAHQHGMEARDALLRQLAAEVQQRLRPDDVLAALGGDSFAAYLPVCDAVEGRRILSEVLAWLKGYRFQRDGDSFSIGATVGLLEFAPGSIESEEVLRRADAACMQATAMGRNQIQLYTADDAGVKGQEALMEWAGRIDKILDRDGLYLRCQLVSPIDPASGFEPYYEILLGVRDPDGANVGPQPFIQAVERWNRVHDIDRWVVDKVFQWVRGNRDTFDAIGGFSVNLSAQSLNNEELLAFLHRELSMPDIPVEKIMFEITETGTINSYAAAQDFIQQIRRYGCKFCIDDFGSGYASYGHLKNLHTDTLKIDGIFIKDMLSSPADLAMVRSMNEIGHSLGMKVVAEFVATPEILAAVREIGVDYAQGYALHEPMPIEGLVQAVADRVKAGDTRTG
jgi:diguanylate cyclase (GGDEF)-like protein